MKKMSTLTQVLVAAAIGTTSTAVMAHTTATNEGLSGYVVDNSNNPVRSGFGQCVRTSSFTPALATQACDPDLLPKMAAAPAPAVAPAPAPAPAPAAAPQVIITKVDLSADTYFDFDKATLKPAGKQRVDEEVAKLGNVDLKGVIAIGHTDSVGAEAYNQKLSLRRAEAVKAYLVSKGVPADAIQVKGMGESQPVASNKTRDGRAKNRRVEIEFSATQKVVK